VNNEEVTPVRDIVVRVMVDTAPKRVLLAPSGEALDHTVDGGQISIRLPRLDLYALIVIES